MKATVIQSESRVMPVLLAHTPQQVHKFSLEVVEYKVRPATPDQLQQLVNHYKERRHA